MGEVHLVKSCEFQNELRRILLRAMQHHFSSINFDIFTPLIQSDCSEVQHAFGKFLYPMNKVQEYYTDINVLQCFYYYTGTLFIFYIALVYPWAAHFMYRNIYF